MATSLSTLSNLKSALKGGSRPNLFNVTIDNPIIIGTLFAPLPDKDLLCKSAAIPGMTIGMIEIPFRGRSIKVPGDRTYAEWTATFISDGAFVLRKNFETWLNTMKYADYGANPTSLAQTKDGYYSSINIKQLDAENVVTRTYTLKDAFPTDVSAMDVSYDTTDALQEFTVTFQYSYFTAL